MMWGGKGGWSIINAIASSGAWSSAVLLEPVTVNKWERSNWSIEI